MVQLISALTDKMPTLVTRKGDEMVELSNYLHGSSDEDPAKHFATFLILLMVLCGAIITGISLYVLIFG